MRFNSSQNEAHLRDKRLDHLTADQKNMTPKDELLQGTLHVILRVLAAAIPRLGDCAADSTVSKPPSVRRFLYPALFGSAPGWLQYNGTVGKSEGRILQSYQVGRRSSNISRAWDRRISRWPS